MKLYRALFSVDWHVARRILLAALGAVAMLSLFPSTFADEHASNPVVLELKIDGEVEPILATYIDEGITDAANRHASLVLITMDTPGGLSDSMKDII
jgi:membrane-bound serine protease (ClpP class)